MRIWTSLVLLATLVVSGLSFPHPDDHEYKIPSVGTGQRSQYYVLHKDGTYKYGFDTGDGAFESVKSHALGSLDGKFGYVDPDGNTIKLEYEAGRGGFVARGDHLPKPSPELAQALAAVVKRTEPFIDPLAGGDSDASYGFKFQSEDHSRTEEADSDGTVTGSYSYTDENGVLRRFTYRAGKGIGFVIEGDGLTIPIDAPARSNVVRPTIKSNLPFRPVSADFRQSTAYTGNQAAIFSTRSEIPGDASYSFSYDADDHSRREVSDDDLNIEGSFSFIGDDGQRRTLNYEAGSGLGFVAQGAHLPVAPVSEFGNRLSHGSRSSQAQRVSVKSSQQDTKRAQSGATSFISSHGQRSQPSPSYKSGQQTSTKFTGTSHNGQQYKTAGVGAGQQTSSRVTGSAQTSQLHRTSGVGAGQQTSNKITGTSQTGQQYKTAVVGAGQQTATRVTGSAQTGQQYKTAGVGAGQQTSTRVTGSAQTGHQHRTSVGAGHHLSTKTTDTAQTGQQHRTSGIGAGQKTSTKITGSAQTGQQHKTAGIGSSQQTSTRFTGSAQTGLQHKTSGTGATSSQGSVSYKTGQQASTRTSQNGQQYKAGSSATSQAHKTGQQATTRQSDSHQQRGGATQIQRSSPQGSSAVKSDFTRSSSATAGFQPSSFSPSALKRQFEEANIRSSSSPDGSYSFSYDTSSHSRSESGDSNNNVVGKFDFIAEDDGEKRKIIYEAGSATGFIAEGAHIPIGPIVPGAPSGQPTGRIVPVVQVPFIDPQADSDSDASYNFKFDSDTYSRSETADEDGNVVGTYSVVDDDGTRVTYRFRAGKGVGFETEEISRSQGPRPVKPIPYSGPLASDFPSTIPTAGQSSFSHSFSTGSGSKPNSSFGIKRVDQPSVSSTVHRGPISTFSGSASTGQRSGTSGSISGGLVKTSYHKPSVSSNAASTPRGATSGSAVKTSFQTPTVGSASAATSSGITSGGGSRTVQSTSFSNLSGTSSGSTGHISNRGATATAYKSGSHGTSAQFSGHAAPHTVTQNHFQSSKVNLKSAFHPTHTQQIFPGFQLFNYAPSPTAEKFGYVLKFDN